MKEIYFSAPAVSHILNFTSVNASILIVFSLIPTLIVGSILSGSYFSSQNFVIIDDFPTDESPMNVIFKG